MKLIPHPLTLAMLCLYLACAACAFAGGTPADAAEAGTTLRALIDRPFFLGREYFVLRSGPAQMVVQADQADLGPAFTFLLFDAQDAAQSARKERALNYEPDAGFASSALRVELGGYRFTALGHRTETGWVWRGGVPAVRAIWWAGGVRVTEFISALSSEGLFKRQIRLEGANLVGPQEVTLELALPRSEPRGDVLVQAGIVARVAMLALPDKGPDRQAPSASKGGSNATAPSLAHGASSRPAASDSALRIGPVTLAPDHPIEITTFLLVQLPAGNEAQLLKRAAELRSSSVAAEEKTRGWWAKTSSVTTEDKTVRDLMDKARIGLAGMVADDGTMDAGLFEYGAQWVRDTSNTALGAIHAGHFELARAALRRVLEKMVRPDGATMIAGGFDEPDREQFDQMGELLHALKAYRDWTGDESLLGEHRDLLRTIIERPLQARFRAASGLVHNRREFWERTLEDGYELAYQMYVIQGLRDAADLAPAIGAEDSADRWRREADRMLAAVLGGPKCALVEDGRLIKRRNVTGGVADLQPQFRGFQPDTPARTEVHTRLLPDATQALPIALRMIDPGSPLARRTLDELEGLWNTRWSDGGYDRYHTSSQPDQPGPWPFATCFILRAQHEAGCFERSRRSLEWLNTVQGGRAGAWFEEIPSIRSTERTCGIVPWTSAEIALFVVRHWLGVSFDGEDLVLRPALYPGAGPVSADLRFRDRRLHLRISGPGGVRRAVVNGMPVEPDKDGRIRLSREFHGGEVAITTAPSANGGK